VDEAGAVHRLDDGEHIGIAQSLQELGKPVLVGRHRARADHRSVGA